MSEIHSSRHRAQAQTWLFFIWSRTMHNNNIKRNNNNNNNQDQAFQSMSEIHAYKGEKLNALDIKITRYLMFQIREEGRRQTRLHGIPFIITAHELLGKSAFSRIFGDERMPSLKQTIEIADKLNMFVEIRARHAGNKAISDRLLAEGKLSRKALMKLVERLANPNWILCRLWLRSRCMANAQRPAFRFGQINRSPRLSTLIAQAQSNSPSDIAAHITQAEIRASASLLFSLFTCIQKRGTAHLLSLGLHCIQSQSKQRLLSVQGCVKHLIILIDRSLFFKENRNLWENSLHFRQIFLHSRWQIKTLELYPFKLSYPGDTYRSSTQIKPLQFLQRLNIDQTTISKSDIAAHRQVFQPTTIAQMPSTSCIQMCPVKIE
jgi:hypothetical protein